MFRTHLRTLALIPFAIFVAGTLGHAQSAPAAPAPPPAPAPAPAVDISPDDFTSFFFHNGDTPTVFLGDSITEQKLFTTLIETYVLSRYPDWKITFRNAGWEGDTAGMAKRNGIAVGLPRDVLSLNPKAVVIDYGMNDAHAGKPGYTAYLKNTSQLIEELRKAGARVALLTSSPEEKYESDAPAGSGYNVMLKKYADGLKIVADNERVPLVDQFDPFVADIEAGRDAGILSKTAKSGDEGNVRLIPDGVHPNWGGHFIMASIILQGLHAPAMVSSVSVDASGHSITGTEGCTVEWVDAGDGVVEFKRTDRALPWPVPGISPEVQGQIDVALKIPGFDPATTLNQYLVKVTGLSEPSYKLTIDGQLVGVFSSADLAKGINLGFYPHGPLYDQGQQLLQAVIAKNDAYFERWREVQLYQKPDWLKPVRGIDDARTAELERLDGVIADEEKAIQDFRKTPTRLFRLEPAK